MGKAPHRSTCHIPFLACVMWGMVYSAPTSVTPSTYMALHRVKMHTYCSNESFIWRSRTPTPAHQVWTVTGFLTSAGKHAGCLLHKRSSELRTVAKLLLSFLEIYIHDMNSSWEDSSRQFYTSHMWDSALKNIWKSSSACCVMDIKPHQGTKWQTTMSSDVFLALTLLIIFVLYFDTCSNH